MKFITQEQLAIHCKADGDDDELMVMYGNAAETFCIEECEVRVFLNDAERIAARAELTDTLRDAMAERDAANDAADDEPDATIAAYMRSVAEDEYQRVRLDMAKIERGRVVNDSFRAAILLVAGHLYRNREEVTSGINHGATKLPVGYKHFIHQFTRYGV